MLVLPVFFLTYKIISKRVSDLVAFPLTFALVFTIYELLMYVLPFVQIDPFHILTSSLIQVAPLVLTICLSTKILIQDLNIKNVNDLKTNWQRKVDYLYQLPSIVAVLIIVFSFIRLGAGSMAFVMSGDARNHMWFSRFMISEQGLNSNSASFYPVLPDAMIALVRSGLGFYEKYSSNHLTLDLVSMSVMCLLVLILMSQAHIFIGKSILSPVSNFTMIAIATLSMLPFTALVSTVALADGFYPALFASLALQVFFLAAKQFTSKLYANQDYLILITILLLIPILASTWTILLIFPFIYCAVFMLIKRKRLLQLFKIHRSVQLALLISLIGLALNLLPILSKGAASNYVKLPGAISPPPPLLIFTILILFLIYFIYSFYKLKKTETIFLLTILITLLFTALVLALIQDNHHYWNYYPAKFTWIALISLFPLLFSVAARDFSENIRVLSLALVPTMVLLIWSFSNSPWIKLDYFSSSRPQSVIYSGWYSPSSISVNQVLKYGKKDTPIVFWELADPSGDRLANFWLATYLPARFDNPVLATNYLRDWAYYEIPGDINSLCTFLIGSDLNWEIVTKNYNLESDIRTSCFNESLENRIVFLQ